MSYNKQKQVSTTKIEDFEAKDLTFDPWLENDKSKTQPQAISFHNYKHKTMGDRSKLRLQLPWIKMYQYGVPRLCDWVKTDRDRSKVKIPFDVNNKEIALAVSKLQELDIIMSSDEMKKKLFPGKKPEKYLYISTIKTPMGKDEDDEPVVKTDLPLSMTLKLKVDKDVFPEIIIQTEVYQSVEDSTGKRVRTKLNVTNVDEFAQQLRYQSTFRAIIEPVKLWSDKKAKPGIDKLQYGIMWQLYMVEVEPSDTNTSANNSNVDFIDDDDVVTKPVVKETPVKETVSKPAVKEVVSKPAVKETIKEESEDSDEEEEDEVVSKPPVVEESEEELEEEPEPVPEPPKKTKKAVETTTKGKKK